MGCGVALMWGRIKLWLAGVATAVAGLVALYLRGKAAGQKEAENKHVRRRVNYCDIAGPMYFDDTDTVTWLYENDDRLLAEIVVNNETWAELCTGKTSP